MNVLDYVREINELSASLLHSHREILARKDISRKLHLIQAIKLDLDKIAHALVEVKENSARAVLHDFFGGSRLNPTEICQRLANQHIYHLGFEIFEPMELVLYGIRHWIEKSRQALGVNMQIKECLRFPASPMFQERVGAYTEIMRIWLHVNDRLLMLELFDIHRPANTVIEAAPRLTHRNFHGLFRQDGTALDHEQRLASLFSDDEIWHHAFYVSTPRDVTNLHAELQALTAKNPKYSMPYNAPVHNRHDGSFHTKIVMRPPGESRRELEFVTEYQPQPRQGQ